MIKPSHYTTPRTLNECVFIPSADPLEVYGRESWFERLVRKIARLSRMEGVK